MLITLVLALFLIIVVSTRANRGRKRNGSFIKRNGKYLIIGFIVLSTILAMNIFRPRVYLNNFESIIENAVETNNDYVAWKKREIQSRLHPYDVPKLLEYVEDCYQFETYKKSNLLLQEYSVVPEMQRLALAYADALVKGESFRSKYAIGPDGQRNQNYPDTTKAYHNFIIGIQKLNDGDTKGSIRAFEREKKINSEFAKTYPSLYIAYKISNRERFRKFITNPENTQYLDQKVLVTDYFLLGEYYLYFKTIYAESFVDFDFFALLAALVITLIWMIFLRNMDFFQKERWIDMTIVFLGGALFTNLCLLGYDFAHYTLGIRLTGEADDDLFYCIGVIGFLEEAVKLIPWLIFAYFSKRLKEPFDYILYASVAALGFAFTENLIYLESPNNISTRFIMSTIMHMFCGSLVAYSIVLAKFKFNTQRAKVIAPIIGFILACVAHGFYDFWLISESADGYRIITTIFFFLTLHIWFHMINNSTNHSSFFDRKLIKMNGNIEFLSISILGIMLLQYVILSINYGAISANTGFRYGTLFTVAFLLYVTFVLSNFKAIRGRWAPYSFPMYKLIQEYLHVPFIPTKTESHVGLHLRIFCPKNNQYIGSQLPVSGHCERKITINNDENWYLFRLNRGITLSGHLSHLVIIKPKSREHQLDEEKIEIYLMFIPPDVNIHADNISIKRLRYTGKAYSLPI